MTGLLRILSGTWEDGSFSLLLLKEQRFVYTVGIGYSLACNSIGLSHEPTPARKQSAVLVHAGSPFAAYAKAIPDDAMTLEHLKSTGDTTLRKSLSEGEAGEIQKSLFRFMHPETSGEPRNHTAGASTSPLSLLRSGASR